MEQTRRITSDEMKRRVFGGARMLLDGLSREELEALQPLLLNGDAEIVNEGCRPYVIRKLPHW